jgi:hypothetical protein
MAMKSVQADQLSPQWRADRVWRLLVLAPFAEALVLSLLATSYFPALASKPPDMVGIPFGLVLDAILLAWAALGARVVWTTRSPIMASLAVITTTIPAMAVLPFTPAIILIMQNL